MSKQLFWAVLALLYRLSFDLHVSWCDVGMPLVHVIQILKTQLHVLKHADVIFSQYAPLEGDLLVELRENGILLKFDPYSQRLKVRAACQTRRQTTCACVIALRCVSVNRCV